MHTLCLASWEPEVTAYDAVPWTSKMFHVQALCWVPVASLHWQHDTAEDIPAKDLETRVVPVVHNDSSRWATLRTAILVPKRASAEEVETVTNLLVENYLLTRRT